MLCPASFAKLYKECRQIGEYLEESVKSLDICEAGVTLMKKSKLRRLFSCLSPFMYFQGHQVEK